MAHGVESRAVAGKPHNAVVKFDMYGNFYSGITQFSLQ